MAPDQRRPDHPRLPSDGGIRRSSVHRRRAGAGLDAGAWSSSAGRHARPDPSLSPGARRRPLRHSSWTHLSHARFVGRGPGLQGLHGPRRRGPNGSFGAERESWPRSVHLAVPRRPRAPARTRRARPGPARRRQRRVVACSRQRLRTRRRSLWRARRHRAEAPPTLPVWSASPPKQWPAPLRRSIG